jgi:hypothetical protein
MHLGKARGIFFGHKTNRMATKPATEGCKLIFRKTCVNTDGNGLVSGLKERLALCYGTRDFATGIQVFYVRAQADV